MKPEYSLLASLFISETSHSNAKFGEDKATTAELHNAAAARGILEGFLAVFRGFSRQWTSPPYGRPSFPSIFPFLPFFSFFFSFRTADEPLTLFSREDICAIIFSGRRSLFRSFSLFLSRIPRTHATCTIKDAYACIMTRERTRVRRADRTGAENIA